MNKELEAINLTLDLMERLIQPTIFEGLKSDLNAIDFKLNRLSKLDKLLELYKRERIMLERYINGNYQPTGEHSNVLNEINALEEELK
jgi:hypothetical protein